MIKTTEEKKYTAAEYFELERVSEVKHEYYFGKLIEMPGEAKRANSIALNLTELLRRPLKKKKLDTFTHDVMVSIQKDDIYRYPDLVVAPSADDDDEYLVLQPVLMAEVSSENSAYTDSVVKMLEYIKIPTMKYYLVIYQDKVVVKFHRNENNKWESAVFTELSDVIDLEAFDIKIKLEEIYEGAMPKDKL